jgi:hypothetical protein
VGKETAKQTHPWELVCGKAYGLIKWEEGV